MKYAGECPNHGLVAHEADQKTLDLKGGPFCPYCGKLVLVLKTDKKKKK
jgi:hypothetical protein